MSVVQQNAKKKEVSNDNNNIEKQKKLKYLMYHIYITILQAIGIWYVYMETAREVFLSCGNAPVLEL